MLLCKYVLENLEQKPGYMLHFFKVFLFFAGWNVDLMPGAQAALWDHKKVEIWILFMDYMSQKTKYFVMDK